MISHGKSWVVRRSYENFEFLDRQAHQCIFDRKYSHLPIIPQEENVTPNNGQSHKVRMLILLFLIIELMKYLYIAIVLIFLKPDWSEG